MHVVYAPDGCDGLAYVDQPASQRFEVVVNARCLRGAESATQHFLRGGLNRGIRNRVTGRIKVSAGEGGGAMANWL